jgi:hypothetical protein
MAADDARRLLRTGLSLAISAVLLGLAAACGSSSSTVTSPTTITRCSVSANGSGGSLPAGGGPGTISVAAARECAWTASTEGSWLSIRSGRNGQGDGAVEFMAAANPDPSARRGAVILNEQRVEVVQAAGECAISLAENGATFPQAGGAGQVEVRASSGQCAWTAESQASWIVLRGGKEGKGSSAVPFDVTATTGPPRTGTIVVAGQQFSVTQSEGCAYRLTPDSYAAPSSGGSGALTLTTGPACPWTAASNVNWVTLGQSQGTGSGTIAFTVTPGSGRSGTVVAGGQTFTISQGQPQSSCVYTIEPRSHSVGAAGGTVAISVATGSGCQWNASTPASWVGLNGAGAFVGSGSVSFTVGPASAPSRSATVMVADQPVTISQSASCTYTIAPEQRSVDAAGATFDVAVSAPAGCSWTAASQAPWITVRDSGAGAAQVTVAANTGDARTGTVSIAGRTLTVTQAAAPRAACAYSVRPRSVKVGSRGGLLQLDVQTSRECAWTAAPDVPWIRVVSGGSGSGDGAVTLLIARNDGSKREGRVTIGTEAVTVEQKKASDDDDDD